MSNVPGIEVWIGHSADNREAGEVKGAMPSLQRCLERSSASVAVVASDILADNLRQFLAQIERSIIDTPPRGSAFQVEQIELNIVVNANGGIELVGKAIAGAEASMKVVLKRKTST